MSRFPGLPRALWVGGGLGKCEHQGAPAKAPNGVSCHSRRWPITSLAVDMGFWQVKDLGVFGGGGGRVGVGRVVDWDCCRERTPGGHGGGGEECGKGRQGFKGSRRRHRRERPVCGNASEEPAEAIAANVCVQCEKAGKARAFRKARQAGKGGVGGNFKGT